MQQARSDGYPVSRLEHGQWWFASVRHNLAPCAPVAPGRSEPQVIVEMKGSVPVAYHHPRFHQVNAIMHVGNTQQQHQGGIGIPEASPSGLCESVQYF